jgi:broad specificity phosphatase PhoE
VTNATTEPTVGPRRLVLLRHGRTAWNLIGRAQGHTDVTLDDTGREQAAATAPYLAGYDAVALWSSDLARARETAAYVEKATGLEPVTDPRLREFDVGGRSGLTAEEFAERYPEAHAAWAAGHVTGGVPGAETIADVTARMVPALREMLASLAPGETGIVVSHGACIKVSLMALLGLPAESEEADDRRAPQRSAAAGLLQRDLASRRPAPGGDPRFRIGRPEWLVFRELSPRLPGKQWGCGAAGSAPAWHAGGQGFESPQLHQHWWSNPGRRPRASSPSSDGEFLHFGKLMTG